MSEYSKKCGMSSEEKQEHDEEGVEPSGLLTEGGNEKRTRECNVRKGEGSEIEDCRTARCCTSRPGIPLASGGCGAGRHNRGGAGQWCQFAFGPARSTTNFGCKNKRIQENTGDHGQNTIEYGDGSTTAY